jgi:hypothetical protein
MAKKQAVGKAVYRVRSAESRNGGARIKGAASDGAIIARIVRREAPGAELAERA